MKHPKIKHLVIVMSIFVGTCLKSIAACTADASTSRPAVIPGALQSAISTLNAKLSLPLKIGSQGVTVSTTVSPSLSITEQDCKDDEKDNCICGKYGTGSGAIALSTTLSANIGSKNFGPFSASAWGYTVSVSASAILSASGSGGTSSNVTLSLDCSAEDWTYSASGSYSSTLSVTGSGSGTGSITETDEDGNPVPVATASLSATVNGTGNYNATYSISAGGVSGSITAVGYSASLAANISGYGTLNFAITL